MKALLIPIKDPAGGKTRLAPLLSAEERNLLAWTMLEHVCYAANKARKADLVAVVSSSDSILRFARMLGWAAFGEREQLSESASVDWASRLLAERGFDTVMRLPADLPLVQAEDIDELLSVTLTPPAALLVPSRDGTGTNAIIRTPPGLFPSRFGPDSLALHKLEAARIGVDCLTIENRRIALDIDEPADLEALMKEGTQTQTFAELARMGVLERLVARNDN